MLTRSLRTSICIIIQMYSTHFITQSYLCYAFDSLLTLRICVLAQDSSSLSFTPKVPC
nr:MAG TPA: hypothetical protein [Caudoviricetes sp.]